MKTLKHTLIIACLSISFFACKQNKVTEIPEENITLFGENFDRSNVISYEQFNTQLADKDSLVATITGTVESVCQVKGCWANIVSVTNPDMESMFVKFKDYGFFLPKDISGKEITLQGVGYREVTSVEELRHYAEDEGLSAEEIAAITEPQEELKFMASGVVMSND